MRAWLLVLFALASLLGGCAHPISLNADTSTLIANAGAKLDKRIGLVISDEQRGREFTGPGGGGDKVSFYAYRDLEVGLYAALSQVFSHVARVKGPQDAAVKGDGLQLLISPQITTMSYSPSLLTWPPTVFTVTLDCTLSDDADKLVARVRVQGEGRAEFDEFKRDFSLSAKRAATDALHKLIAALRQHDALR